MIQSLLEKSRNELISQSKKGKRERDGKTRYEKRLKSRVASSNKSYNRLDMNSLFKDGILNLSIDVRGETDNYIVKISYGGFLDALKDELKRNNDELDLRVVIRALVIGFNKNEVYLKCTCPDWQYRFHYWATIENYNNGEPELRPADETNPDNELGAGCKHVLLVLGNTSWIIKASSVIMNYIKYIEQHQPRLYQKIIYPAIYNKQYEEPTQLDITDISDEEPELSSEEQDIDTANIEARKRGQFKTGNQYRIQPKDTIEGQESIEDIGEEE